MKYVLISLLLVMSVSCCLQARRDRSGRRGKSREYQERMQKAIVKSDLSEVQRLLKRYSKMTMKRFDDVQGWAGDVLEERKMKDPTGFEAVLGITGYISMGVLVVAGFGHYTGLWDPHMYIDPELSNKIKWAILGYFTLGELKYLTGSQNRLQKAEEVKDELQKSIKEIKLDLASQKVHRK